jgi:hypothetical protein
MIVAGRSGGVRKMTRWVWSLSWRHSHGAVTQHAIELIDSQHSHFRGVGEFQPDYVADLLR